MPIATVPTTPPLQADYWRGKPYQLTDNAVYTLCWDVVRGGVVVARFLDRDQAERFAVAENWRVSPENPAHV